MSAAGVEERADAISRNLTDPVAPLVSVSASTKL
jgi:hypothetical protein